MAELPDVGSIDTLLEEKALQKKLLSLSEKDRDKYFKDQFSLLQKFPSKGSGMKELLSMKGLQLQSLQQKIKNLSRNKESLKNLDAEIDLLLNEKRMMQMNFAEGDVVELPDVGSIQPLTEAEKRAAFGTPLTRALKMDPISLERSPIKRGIASIGSNILDMLPGFSLQKGMQEGDPIQMGIGITDLIPGAALLKVGSKAVTDLANKVARMSPEEIAAVKQQYNPVFRNIYEQQERIINAPNANPADVADALEKQRKINANYSIMFDNAGKKFNPDKAVGKKSFIGEEFNPVELETGYDSLQEYMQSIVRYPGPIPFDPDLKKQIIKYIQDNPQKVESIALRKKLQRTDLDDAIDSLD